MSRQPTREEIQRYVQRWHQLKQQYGDQVQNVPEYNQLLKVIRFFQLQAAQRQQQQQQQQQQNGVKPNLAQLQQGQLPQQSQFNAMGNVPGNMAGGNASNVNQINMNQMGGMANGNPMAQNINNQPYMQMQGMAPGSHASTNAMNTPAVGNANVLPAGGQMPMMSGPNSHSPISQSPHALMANTPSVGQPQGMDTGLQGGIPPGMHGGPAMGQMQTVPGAAAATALQQGAVGNSLGNNGFGSGPTPPNEGPFSQQQMQLLKLQHQMVKMLFRNPGNGFPAIPQNLAEMATNERLAFSGDPSQQGPQKMANQHLQNQQLHNQIRNQPPMAPVNPQSRPQSVIQQLPAAVGGAVPGLVPFHSPQLGVQQPPTPSSRRGTQIAAQGQPSTQMSLQGGTPKPTQDRAEPKKRGKKSATGTPRIQPASQPSSSVPVTRPAEPPLSFDELSQNEDLSKQLIVPISKPNLVVDTFELPKVGVNMKEDISFNSLYSGQNRIKYPYLMPNSIDIDDIVANRESHIMLQIDARVTQLQKKLESTTDESEKNDILVELGELELLPYQKEVRGKILSQLWFSRSLLPNSHPNFLAKFGSLTLENVVATEELYKQQLNSLVQAQNKKHQVQVSKILQFHTKNSERINARREKLERLGIRINSLHTQIAKEEQKKVERMAKQRLQALKLNDEEAYLKLLDHTKDTRITHLLNQTNQFLDSLAQAVQTQQKATQELIDHRTTENEPEVDDEPAEEKREKVDYYHVAHRVKEEVLSQPTILVGGTLKEYQLKGLQWMVSLYNNHLNGILADEMGLGKTIQTISLLTYLVEKKNVPGPFLVIVPLSTLTNWNLEFEKWAPALKKITYKGTPVQRKVLQQEVRQGNFQVLLTTFEYIIKDKSLLSKTKWVHMIIDEGHRMKNTNSKLSETLTQNYHSDYRLILTGTPLQNNLPELWALLNFVLPKIFNSVKSFDDWFNTPFANTGGQDKIELSEEESLLVIRRLHKVLRPFLLRRLKKDVEKDLPNKVEKVVKCKMSSLQSKLYRMMLKYNALFAGESVTGQRPSTIKNANNQLMQLRKICNHPFVYEEVENIINPRSETNDTIWRVAGKFELLDKILPKFKQTGHRVLIFFQMTQIMDIMEDFLRLRDMKYMRLDGATKSDDRTELLRLFNAPDSEYFCFLLSTRAGGLGLNLQSADTVIIFDSDWNPHQDLQAQDRAHRIGQKNEVRILRLVTEDSIEEVILERAVKKLEIDGKVIQAGKFDNKSTAEEQEALLRALMEKEEERRQKGGEDDDELDDEELNQVIARNEDEIVKFREIDEDRALELKNAGYPSRLYSDQELPEIYQKDPEVYYKTDEQLIEEYGRGNRERKMMKYDDNMTEEEWLKKIDGYASEESEDDIAPRKKGRPRKDESEKRRRANTDGEPAAKRPRSSTPSNRSKKGKIGRPRLKGASNRATPSIDPLTPEERETLQARTAEIYTALLELTTEDRKLSDMFLVKPSKKLYPDYYVLIKHPLALDAIKKRMANKTYTNIREFLEDLHLIFSNARIYNEEGSIVYQDASVLENLALAKFKELYQDMPKDEIDKTLDFTEFDEINNLKPLAISGTAIKQPVDVQSDKGSNVESKPETEDPLKVGLPANVFENDMKPEDLADIGNIDGFLPGEDNGEADRFFDIPGGI